jgi:hypothetical protein
LSTFGLPIHIALQGRDVNETVEARRPRNHLVSLPIGYDPAYVLARHPGHCRKVALADLVTEHEVPRAVVLAAILSELDDPTAWKHHESFGPIGALDDSQFQVEARFSPRRFKSPALVATIGKELFPERIYSEQGRKK